MEKQAAIWSQAKVSLRLSPKHRMGVDDAWIALAQGRQLADKLTGGELVPVPRAGHLVREDAPETIVAAVPEIPRRRLAYRDTTGTCWVSPSLEKFPSQQVAITAAFSVGQPRHVGVWFAIASWTDGRWRRRDMKLRSRLFGRHAMEGTLNNVRQMGSSAPKVFRSADLTLIGRLYLECCTIASAGSNAPLEDTIKMRIARSLIRSLDLYEHDPETMKKLALRDSRLVA
jgi:hypothetical protein